PVTAALSVLPHGSAAVQLRQPAIAPRELLERARALRRICDRFAAPLLVNDRADVALAAGADGVHLPTRGLPPGDARSLGLRLVGVSVHSPDDVARASRDGADFAVFAPVYETPGKPARGEAAGPQLQQRRPGAMGQGQRRPRPRRTGAPRADDAAGVGIESRAPGRNFGAAPRARPELRRESRRFEREQLERPQPRAARHA